VLIGTANINDPLKRLYLIDFGLATPYLEPNINSGDLRSKHIQNNQMQLFKGNLAFSSHNIFNGCTASRRDDMISLVYFLLYLSTGYFAFVKHNIPLANQIDRIKKMKNKYKPHQFCKFMKCEHLTQFCKNIYDLKFADRPNYGLLRHLLAKNLME